MGNSSLTKLMVVGKLKIKTATSFRLNKVKNKMEKILVALSMAVSNIDAVLLLRMEINLSAFLRMVDLMAMDRSITKIQ